MSRTGAEPLLSAYGAAAYAEAGRSAHGRNVPAFRRLKAWIRFPRLYFSST